MALALCLCGPLLGCGEKAPPAPAAPGAEVPKAPAVPAPEPELPPVADVPLPEWAEVDDEKFLELPARPAAPEPKWDFSPDRRFGYEVAQLISQKVEARRGEQSGKVEARDRSRGTFEFVAGKDRTALVLVRFHTEEAFRDGVATPKEDVQKQPPSRFEAVVKEDGSAEIKKPAGRADASFFFDAVLALGEGERTLRDGRVRTRAAGFAKVERYECLRLESEFEFRPQSPAAATLLRGRTIAYFAPAERRFVRASSTLWLSSRTKERGADGAWVVKKIDSNTTLRFRLIETP